MRTVTRVLLTIFLFCSTSYLAQAITAGFTADVTAGCAPLVVNFTNTSTGATSYVWDFHTGTMAYGTDASTSFTLPGTYIVELTATSGGVSVKSTMTITVYPKPAISFTASPSSACPGVPITFTSTTIGGVPGPMKYTWGFGDGSLSTLAGPVHTYTASGSYNVTLAVTNATGCDSLLTIPSFVKIFPTPVAAFSAASIFLCKVPGTATFVNLSTGTPTLSYLWDLGDGSTSTATTPSHTYTGGGAYAVKLVVKDGNGCMDSVTKPSFINVGSMKASFTSPSLICTNDSATFANTSTSHFFSNWNFGDGGTATTENGGHRYRTPGTYTVRLIISDGVCSDTVTNIIKVVTGPAVSFTMSPANPCPAPATAVFTGSAPGSTITWGFGDGGTAVGPTASHTFASNGPFAVTMTAKDPVTGCVSDTTRIYTIFDIYRELKAGPNRGCVPLKVNFSLLIRTTTTNIIYPYDPYPFPVTSFSWTYGDGSAPSSGPTPSHTYTAQGIYNAICTIVTSNGCTYTDTIHIEVGNPPVITATGQTKTCFSDRAVYIAKLVDPLDSIDEYHWYPETGSVLTDINVRPTDTLKYKWSVPGVWSFTVVPSFRGCPGPPVVLTKTTVDSPRAIIFALPLCAPYQRVQLIDRSLGGDSRIWYFGDGTTSTAPSVIHSFPTAGVYTISLVSFNSRSGCKDSATFDVDLSHPTVDFSASKTRICPSDTVLFRSVIVGGAAIGYNWSGGGLFLPFPSIVSPLGPDVLDSFPVPGVYTIRLILTDHNGCRDTVIKPNYITVGKPDAHFTATPTTGCSPLLATFTDASTDVFGATPSKYLWVFGDGGTSTVTTPSVTHTYTTGGSFSIREIVIDDIGCKDTVTLPLITVWKPTAAFNANQYPCLGDSTKFKNTSTGMVSCMWMFGDGGTSTLASPWHTYTAPGKYTVSLAVVDAHGCKDTATYPAYIDLTTVTASFTASDTFAICPPLIVNFTNTSVGATSYYWDLGDGTTSAISGPSNLYITVGDYLVKMIATNIHGCTDTATEHINLYGYAGAFTYSPLTGCSPLTVHFKSSVSNVPDIVWDFSDGTTSKASKVDTVDHIYTRPGNYVPKLILGDDKGCQNSSLGLDTIKVNKVTPDMKSAPDPVCINGEVKFTSISKSYFSTITSLQWMLSDGTVTTVSEPTYIYKMPGTYTVTLIATDGWGCIDSIKKEVQVFPAPEIKTSPDTIICVSDKAALSAYGGATYVWSPALSLSCTTCNPTMASPVTKTTYTVTGTDKNGCINTDTVIVGLKTKTVSTAAGDTAVCKNIVVPLHDTGGTSYLWIPATGLSNPKVAHPFAMPAATTRYTVVAYLGSCIPDTNVVWVTVYPLPTVNAGEDQRLVEGSTAQLEATGTLIEKYSWGGDLTLSCDSCPAPLATMSVTTTYGILVTSAHGCKASDSVTIHIYCDKSQIFIPNTFTPNGDGQNDVFYPHGIGVSIINTFRIYNRWGELLFERSGIEINDASNAWDGSYHGSAPRPDVYVYVLEALCETGEPIYIKGDVTVIR